jgi:vitamin B12 transporter
VTDLLAESAAGYLSQWSQGQTYIKIRGAQTDGQGRDYKGDVLVLINGRRAGTANLSKLSTDDVLRIEIMKGPASVMYGSQALGAVINIILKDGISSPGLHGVASGGSWGLGKGSLAYGGSFSGSGAFSGYISANYNRRDSYKAGKGSSGTQFNTMWERYGGMASLSHTGGEDNSNRVDLTFRTQGIYHTGFRGSGSDYFNKETRENQSVDLIWDHKADSPEAFFSMRAHAYYVVDQDNLTWGGQDMDYNPRKLKIMGLKLQPLIRVSPINEILLGADFEKSVLRSDMKRLTNPNYARPPMDNNQTERIFAFYAEDTLKVLDDRLIARGGLRYTMGKTSFDNTPNYREQKPGSRNYNKLTWSAGLNLSVTPSLSLKAGAASGFRAPLATEIVGELVHPLSGWRTYGRSNVKPQTNTQFELGAVFQTEELFIDLVYFQNSIKNRISDRVVDAANRIAEIYNSPGKMEASGIELDARLYLDSLLGLNSNGNNNNNNNTNLVFGLSGNAYFRMVDKGRDTPEEFLNRGPYATKVMGQNVYQLAAFLELGQGKGSSIPWSARITANLNGPMYNDTEETFMAGYEPTDSWVHRMGSYWLFHLYGDLEPIDNVTFFAGINNLLDENYHPMFFLIDKKPYISDADHHRLGGRGTSLPGREFFVGLRFDFF